MDPNYDKNQSKVLKPKKLSESAKASQKMSAGERDLYKEIESI